MDLTVIGRVLIAVGALVLLTGVIFMLAGRIPWLGHLPGDIVFPRDGVMVFIPLTTMIVVSIVLTLLLNIAARLFGD